MFEFWWVLIPTFLYAFLHKASAWYWLSWKLVELKLGNRFTYKLQKLKPVDTEIYLLHQNERYLHKHWVAGQCKYQSCRLEFWWWGESSFIINGLRLEYPRRNIWGTICDAALSVILLPQCLPDRCPCNNTSQCVAVILPWAEHYSQHRHQSSSRSRLRKLAIQPDSPCRGTTWEPSAVRRHIDSHSTNP